MKVLDPMQAYGLLWQGMTKTKVTDRHAQTLLTRFFAQRGVSLDGSDSEQDASSNSESDGDDNDSMVHQVGETDQSPIVLLLDELDFLVTRRQGVIYNLLEWAQAPQSRLIVIAIANTMDLPERVLTKRIASRLGLLRVEFMPYSEQQLISILSTRLGPDCPIVSMNAIAFASRKVAAVNGDARRLLDICRRAVELTEHENDRNEIDGDKNGIRKNLPVTVDMIKRATDEMYASPATVFIAKGATSLQRLCLAHIVRMQRRNGVFMGSTAELISLVRQSWTMPVMRPSDSNATSQDEELEIVNPVGHFGIDFAIIRHTLTTLAQLGLILIDSSGNQIQLNMSEQEAVIALSHFDELNTILKMG
jgi:origin recognition complex subunit 1